MEAEDETKKIELTDAEIEKRIADMRAAYADYSVWRNRVRGEQDAHSARINGKTKNLTELQQEYCKVNRRYIDKIKERAIAVAKQSGLTWQNEAAIFKEVLEVFRQFFCSKTHVVLDAKKDKVIGAARSYGSGASVTAGKFGFGIRYNVNSRPISSAEEVRFVLQNSETICENLRDKKLTKQADMLEELTNAVPTLKDASTEGITVGFEKKIEVVSNHGATIQVHSVKFGNTYNPIELISSNGSIAATPDRGALGFVGFYSAKEEIEKALEVAEQRAVIGQQDVDKTVAKVREVLGRWLLLSQL